MEANVAGRVANTKLAASNGLSPLFEAIFNSIHSLAEAEPAAPEVRILILRDSPQQTLDLHGNFLPDIAAIHIVDNGVGFDDDHFESFNTLDSRKKAAIGGKGMGRIFWLKAFDHAEVESVFAHGDTLRVRRFHFCRTNEGVEYHRVEDAVEGTPRTTRVALVGFGSKYRAAAPKSAESLARRIVEHCLELFALGKNVPSIVVEDEVEGCRIDVNAMYRDEFIVKSQVRRFCVAGETYDILDVLVRRPSHASHSLTFCAHDRSVKSLVLSTRLPVLHGPLSADGEDGLSYYGYVSGPHLDAHVDSERADFTIVRRDELPFSGDEVVWEDIESAAISQAAAYLEPHLAEMRLRSLRRVEDFARTTEPRYHVLLGKRRQEVSELPSTLSDNQLDAELHKILHDWKLEVRQDVQRQLAVADSDDYAIHRDAFQKTMSEFQDAARSELADYVVHRATVISFFERLLGRLESGKFPPEDALHNVVFPQRETSRTVQYDDHNLWILDERLVYHHYLASDLAFDRQADAPVEVSAEDRPDLLIYNRSFAYVPSDLGAGANSVVIVEFKRPERRDAKESPIAQVLRYVKKVRSGKVKREDGSTVEPVPESTPFYCYVVATLTDKLRQDALERGFTEMPDGQGFFSYNPNLRAYVEVLSYRKVLRDAKMRNKVFFDKLNIPIR